MTLIFAFFISAEDATSPARIIPKVENPSVPEEPGAVAQEELGFNHLDSIAAGLSPNNNNIDPNADDARPPENVIKAEKEDQPLENQEGKKMLKQHFFPTRAWSTMMVICFLEKKLVCEIALIISSR